MRTDGENQADLNADQAEAAGHRKGPLLVVAGAGTGKTRVIVERTSRLLDDGTPADSILALTFTEKAAAEMVDRVNELRGEYSVELPMMTFNAFGESLLRRYASDIGFGRTFRLIGDNAQLVFLRERLDDLDLDYFAPVSRPDGLLKDIADYFSLLKQNVVTPEEYKAYAEKLPSADAAEKLEKKKHMELSSAFRVYLDLCQEANVIDYDDQIYLVIRLMRERPNILRQIQESYSHIMIDEFQDTNVMQSTLVDLLAGKADSLMVVGDDDQSIYGWRGATLANILSFKERYPAAREITLADNYRSTQQILDAAYRLITHNDPHRLEVRLNINKRLRAAKEGGEPAARIFATLDEELDWIADEIVGRIKRGASPGSIAVLARRNATLERLHERLEENSIEHTLVGQKHDLYQEPAVRTLIEALKAVVDPLDSTSLYHTLTGPLFSVRATMLSGLQAKVRRNHEALRDMIRESDDPEAIEAKQALDMLEGWCERSAHKSVGGLAYDILTESGYKERLAAAGYDGDGEAVAAMNRLSDFFSTLREFERIALQPSAVQYLESLPALQAAGDAGDDGTLDLSHEKVNLLSIHKSKGLEWPTVFIADCSEGSFPLREGSRGITLPPDLKKNQAGEADSHLSEERRLMYVAMTRAKEDLFLTCSERHSGRSIRKPSRFLTEAIRSDHIFTIQSDSKRLPVLDSPPGAGSTADVAVPPHILNGSEVSLSVSQAVCYLDCPLNFYYKEILCVPEEPSPISAYGTLMHSLLQDMNTAAQTGADISLDELIQRYESECPKNGFLTPAQRDRMISQGRRTLRRLYKSFTESPRTPISVEERFEAELSDAHMSLRGRFDAVFPCGKGVEIVDYKTSSSIDTPEKAKQRAGGSKQLTLYALAWREIHGELPELVTLDFIDTGMRASIKKTARGVETMADKLRSAADSIRAGKFEPGRDHLFCQHPKL
jgi:DNA helicase II / ATP-dependent DNA helicase PcrA